jgi:hypothetical protein
MTQSNSPAPNPFESLMKFGHFGEMVPGFKFFQTLMGGADKAVPGMGQWVVPTLDPKELERRINDLKVVQFWLEQNGRVLATTIQAMEVQKMTLSTLQSMNVSANDLKDQVVQEAMKVDPMQWWGDLSKQFADVAKTVAASTASASTSTKADGKTTRKRLKKNEKDPE